MLPRLFHIGPFTVYSFGLMVIVGFLVAIGLANRLARERGLQGEAFLDAAVAMLFSSVAGARLLFVLLHWRDYSGHLGDVVAIWQGGMSFHGGLAGGVLAGAIYFWKRKLPVLQMADAAAPAMALGYAIGRVGCLLNGCCYGGATTLPWGMHFPDGDPHTLYHPAQIYASILNLGLMAALIHAYRRPHRAGQILALYMGGYSVYRFAIEALRKGVTAKVLAFGLTEAQVFSLFAVVAAAAWWFWLERRSTPAPPPVPEAPAGVPLKTGA